MTTERAPRQAPRIGLTGLEWKLLLTAALGASYTAAWLAIAEPAGVPASTPPTAGPRRAKSTTTASRAPRTGDRIRTRSS